jgi:heme/copper-type cytochrome/quinol oxidase subunit 2
MVTMTVRMTVVVVIVVVVMGHLSCRRRRGDHDPNTDAERGPR